MKSQIIANMGSFVLGTGATLVALASWLGTTDLQEIKDSVQSYVTESEEQASALISEYNVIVDSANAEIEEYQKALEKANSNISELIEKYEQDQTKAEEDYADLQQAYDEMVARLDSQYETDQNAIIEQANIEINKANEEVAQAKTDVNAIIEGSQVDEIVSGEKSVLNTTGDKSVNGIIDIVGLQIVSVEDLGVEEIGQSYVKLEHYVKKVTFNDGVTKVVAVRTETNAIKYVNTSTTDTYEWNSLADTYLDTEHRTVIEEYLANQQ